MNDLKGIIEDCNKSDLVSNKVIKKVVEIIGQEEWQDLHDEYNDVCTTMGELIITLKGIAELEKENAELRKDKEELCHSISEGGKACVYLNGQLTKAKEIIKELSKSLFLAKGIVRDLIDDTVDFKESKKRATYCYEQENFDTYKKAEQFLNSEVEK